MLFITISSCHGVQQIEQFSYPLSISARSWIFTTPVGNCCFGSLLLWDKGRTTQGLQTFHSGAGSTHRGSQWGARKIRLFCASIAFVPQDLLPSMCTHGNSSHISVKGAPFHLFIRLFIFHWLQWCSFFCSSAHNLMVFQIYVCSFLICVYVGSEDPPCFESFNLLIWNGFIKLLSCCCCNCNCCCGNCNY